MATKVFGMPITAGTLAERVREALNNPNADSKRDSALAYVRQKKADMGHGVSTLGIFYNATGVTIDCATHDNFYGKNDGTYPDSIQNGQWGTFFHVATDGASSGSKGLVAYRVRVSDTKSCTPLIAWFTQWEQESYNNLAYCDIFDDAKDITPAQVYGKMDERNSSQSVVTKLGMTVASSIDSGTSPVFEAKIQMY